MALSVYRRLERFFFPLIISRVHWTRQSIVLVRYLVRSIERFKNCSACWSVKCAEPILQSVPINLTYIGYSSVCCYTSIHCYSGVIAEPRWNPSSLPTPHPSRRSLMNCRISGIIGELFNFILSHLNKGLRNEQKFSFYEQG